MNVLTISLKENCFMCKRLIARGEWPEALPEKTRMNNPDEVLTPKRRGRKRKVAPVDGGILSPFP